MLRAIQLENFKCFQNSGLIRLAPLTLIFGANSAGKSTVLQALYLLMQTRRLGRKEYPLQYSPKNGLFDFGGFNEIVHCHDSRRKIAIRLDVDAYIPFDLDYEAEDPLGVRAWLKGIKASTMGLRIEFSSSDDKTSVDGYRIFVDDDPFATFTTVDAWAGEEEEDKVFFCTDNSANPKYIDYYSTIPIHEDGRQAKQEHLTCIAGRKKLIEVKTKLSQALDGFPPEWPDPHMLAGDCGSVRGLEYFFPGSFCSKIEEAKSYRGEVSRENPDLIGGIAEEIFNASGNESLCGCLGSMDSSVKLLYVAYSIDESLTRLSSLGSLRAEPQRTYNFGGANKDSVGFKGEHMADILYSSKSIEKINNLLDITLDLGYKIEPETSSSGGFAVKIRNLSKPQLPSVSLMDVGFGVSQLLPIIVEGVLSKGRTILVEQPETHLHPALQAQLGTFFVDCMREQRNQFIIETHSEHLILRLQRLIRDKKVSPQDLSILYVSRDHRKGESTIQELKLDEEGEFVDDWPGGFFPERLREFLD